MFIEDEPEITMSCEQTKSWRQNQAWYRGGKHNECEKFQRKVIEYITGYDCGKTNLRIKEDANKLVNIVKPYKQDNGFEYTENFDGIQTIGEKQLLYNLKFVCDSGGAQTRSLKLVYYFIKAQNSIIQSNPDIFFANILDGDESFKAMNKFNYIKRHDNIFCGDMKEFEVWFRINFKTDI